MSKKVTIRFRNNGINVADATARKVLEACERAVAFCRTPTPRECGSACRWGTCRE